MVKTFEASPRPNTMRISGMMASLGMGNVLETSGISHALSGAKSPMESPRITPGTAPARNPNTILCRLTAICERSSPLLNRGRSVPRIREGLENSRASIRPHRARISHMTSKSEGERNATVRLKNLLPRDVSLLSRGASITMASLPAPATPPAHSGSSYLPCPSSSFAIRGSTHPASFSSLMS